MFFLLALTKHLSGMKNEKNAISCRIYDIDNDGFISSEELTAVLKMMVGLTKTADR